MTNINRFIPAFEEGHFYGLVDEGEYLRQSLLYKQILPRTVRRSFSEGGTPSRPKTSMISISKNLSNLSLKICEICVLSFQPLTSTKEFVRKNKLFMQNEPNLKKVKLNVNKVLTRDYEQLDTWSIRKKQSQTNPNKAKTNPIQSQYEPNTKPIQTQTNPISEEKNAQFND